MPSTGSRKTFAQLNLAAECTDKREKKRSVHSECHSCLEEEPSWPGRRGGSVPWSLCVTGLDQRAAKRDHVTRCHQKKTCDTGLSTGAGQTAGTGSPSWKGEGGGPWSYARRPQNSSIHGERLQLNGELPEVFWAKHLSTVETCPPGWAEVTVKSPTWSLQTSSSSRLILTLKLTHQGKSNVQEKCKIAIKKSIRKKQKSTFKANVAMTTLTPT